MFRPLCRLLFTGCLCLASLRVMGAEGLVVEAPDLKWVLMSSAGGDVVQVLDLSRGITPLATLRSAGRGRVLAIRLQREGRRVWVLGERALDVHDAYNGRLLARWALGREARAEAPTLQGVARPPLTAGCRRYVLVVEATLPAEAGEFLRNAPCTL